MWIFLAKAGFFSVVQRAGHPDQLVVRARDGKDLVRLRQPYLSGLGKVLRLRGRDYAARSFTTKKAFAGALTKAVADIDFGNFKAETGRVLGREREAVYHEVWRVLLGLQRVAE